MSSKVRSHIKQLKPGYIMNSDDSIRKRNAMIHLVELGEKRAVPHIIKLLDQEEYYTVRYKAIWAIGELDDSRGINPLAKLLVHDGDSINAVNALSEMSSPLAVDALVDFISAGVDYCHRLDAVKAIENRVNTSHASSLVSALNAGLEEYEKATPSHERNEFYSGLRYISYEDLRMCNYKINALLAELGVEVDID